MRLSILMTCAALALLPGHAASAPAELTQTADTDPLGSSRWQDMQREFFADARVVFDERVRVSAPTSAEDAMNVPVLVDASALQGVEEVLIFADFNPIVKALSFEPGRARSVLGFRLKLQQSTPVRAAARTADGVWHVGGTWVNTTGGGCTLPSTGNASPEWQQRLNEVSARLWSRVDGGSRLRLQIIHPMDTGLAAGIPVFHIETLEIQSGAGDALMTIYPAEPVAENPLFTVDIPPGVIGDGALKIAGRDNNGNRIKAEVTQ